MSDVRPPRSPRLRLALLLAAGLGLSACASGAQDASHLVRDNPDALIDGYLIAHGMAISYVMSGRATPEDLAQTIAYDRAALLAVAGAQLNGGAKPTEQAEAALRRLVDYTGRQDLAAGAVAPPAEHAAPPPAALMSPRR
ncbi:hypothetical protein [Rhizosaccharibacter radicis]|uniref:Uncharacterized protein n=1 Tax=Rhizosaccharibacter radicis TaxID=2782605 RepID=A0ABT1VYA8_9PROT|nr:hypothetical protein [Acetobacteraceae bacterium KSS12]